MSAARAGFGILLWLVLAVAPAQESYDAALIHWSQVLDGYVDQAGRTDFTGLATDRDALDRYVAYVAVVSPASQPEMFPDRASRLAYHINSYNALAMHGVIEAGIPDGFTNFFTRAAFFKFRKVVIGGAETSLYDYENKVIRPLGDARVHFALNCMVRDCPRLPQVPFYPESLDRQLDAAAREFFSKDTHIRLDPDRHEVWLSEILDFYPEDFTPNGKTAELIPYVNRWRESPVPSDYRVRFIDYDWTINRQL